MKPKKIMLPSILLITNIVFACPVCEKKQPPFLQGITHGTGPESNWDWVIIGAVTLITLLTFFFSIKYLIVPGEKQASHIKNSILSIQ